MKKKIIGSVAVMAIAAITAFNVSISKSSDGLTDVSLANVEALAQSENDYSSKVWDRYYHDDGNGHNCTRGGSQSCF